MFRIAFLAICFVVGTVAFAIAEEQKQAVGIQKQLTNSIGMKLTLIPAGEFKMGSDESPQQTAAYFAKNYGTNTFSLPENIPMPPPPPGMDDITSRDRQHRVRITKPFYLGTYHATRGQFRRFVEDSGYKTDAENGFEPGAKGWYPKKDVLTLNRDYSWRNAGFEQTDEHPVVNVSWRDAVAFCKWLSQKEGKTYRLPTEAEWEYACRAGTTTRYSSGDDPETLVKVANVADATFRKRFPESRFAKCAIKASDGYVFTSPVGQFKPNAFGLYDMHGNAWQLCADWFDRKYYVNSPTDDPKGPDTGFDRIRRGGAWLTCPNAARSAQRMFIATSDRDNTTGFRVVREAE